MATTDTTPGLPSAANCDVGGIWFHYERDPAGAPAGPNGIWTLGITYETAALNTWAMTIFGMLSNRFFTAQNPDYYKALGLIVKPGPPPGVPVAPEELASAFYRTAQTVFYTAQGPADDYAFGCADQQCDENGEYFDPTSEQCQALIPIIPLPVVPVVPPVGPGKQPTPALPPTIVPTFDYEQDELGICCQETQTNLVAIVDAIRALKPGDETDTCCVAVVLAINAATAQLRTIASELVAGGAAPPDLAPLTTAVNQIAQAVGGLGAAIATAAAPLSTGLPEIAAAITGLDTAAATAAINRVADALEKPASDPSLNAKFKALIQQMVADGLFPEDLAQIITS